MKSKTWLVIFDSNSCRIYDYTRSHISLLKEIQHPENKLRDIEITSDKPGRYQSRGTVHGAYTQESDPKEIKIDNFAREVARVLEHERTAQAYEKLIFAAPAHMMGLLHKHSDKQVKEMVRHTIEKDLMHFSEDDLLKSINSFV